MSQYLNNIDKFRFLAYKILPLVYDDSLSYYEFLCKVLKKLNEVIDNENEQNELIETWGSEWESVKSELQRLIEECDAAVAEAGAAADNARFAATEASLAATSADTAAENANTAAEEARNKGTFWVEVEIDENDDVVTDITIDELVEARENGREIVVYQTGEDEDKKYYYQVYVVFSNDYMLFQFVNNEGNLIGYDSDDSEWYFTRYENEVVNVTNYGTTYQASKTGAEISNLIAEGKTVYASVQNKILTFSHKSSTTDDCRSEERRVG